MIQREETMLSNKEWVDAVCEEYRPRVYKYIVHLTNDRALSDDLAQEVFRTLWEKVDDVRNRKNVAGWLMKTAEYKVLSEEKKAYHDREILLSEDAAFAADTEEKTAFLECLLPALKDCEREVLIYRVYHKCSFEEVGRAMGCSPMAAQMRFYRVRRKLKGLLGEIL